MKIDLKKLILTALAGALMAPALQAQTVTLITAGGNASIKLIQDRLAASVASGGLGLTVTTPNSANNLLFRATGTFGGKSVDWEFNFTGGAGAIADIANNVPVTLADGVSTAVPQLAISAVAPETVGIDSSPFQEDFTVVVPVVFIKGSALGGITNITQRQAAYLEGAGAHLPASYFGGTNNDKVIYVGRNSIAAVRQLFDANVYFTGNPSFFTTNTVAPYTTPVPYAGASSGTEVAAIVGVLTNSIGTVAAQDRGSFATLSYEGVPYNTTNVINGTYPLWGYERYIYIPNNLSSDQQNLINALEAAVTASSFQTTSSKFIGNFVSYNDLNAQNGRSIAGDGGPITSTVY